MNIATYANTRTANGVRDGLNKGLKIAFASGSVMGLTVVGLGLFDYKCVVYSFEIRVQTQHK